MKYSQILSIFMGVIALSAANETMDHFVQNELPTVWETAKTNAKKIPLMRRTATKGRRQIKYIPEDLYRRYDEASYDVYDRRLRMGYVIPRVSKSG